jgi:hypothetical protein
MSDEDSQGNIMREIFNLVRRKWLQERLQSPPEYFWSMIVVKFTTEDENPLPIIRVLARLNSLQE